MLSLVINNAVLLCLYWAGISFLSRLPPFSVLCYGA